MLPDLSLWMACVLLLCGAGAYVYRNRRVIQRYEMLLGKVDRVIYQCAPGADTLSYVNPVAETMLGIAASAWQKNPKQLEALVLAQDREVFRRGRHCMVQGEFRTFRYRIQRGAVVRWLEEHLSLSSESGESFLLTGVIQDVTEQVELEHFLRLRERALASVSTGVVISDMQVAGQPVIYVNPAFERITGYGAEEVLGRNCSLLQKGGIPDEEQAWVIEDIRRIIQAGESGRVTIRNYRKDGEAFWNELQLSPILDEVGRITHYIGVQDDITSKIRNVQDLTVSKQKLALTIDALHEGVWDWDMTNNGLITSPSWARILGLDPVSFGHAHTIETFTSCLPVEWRKTVFQAIEAHAAEETPELCIEHQMVRQDGQFIWVITHGKVVERSLDGQPLRMVGSLVDVTERVAASEKIIALMSQLDVVLTLTPDGIVHFDDAGQISIVNYAFERLTGLRAGEISGLGVVNLIDALRDKTDPKFPFPECWVTRPGQALDDRQLIHMLPPGERVLQMSWHRPSSGNACVLYLRDVTRETEVDRMKSEFLSTAAHELRTPMASIMGFSELLTLRDFPPEKTRDMLSTIHRQAKRLTTLINELLDLARIEARNGKVFQLSLYPLAQVMDDAVKAFSLEWDQRRVVLRMPPELPPVMIDPAKLQQAVLNLLSNAYKYSPDGGDVMVQVQTCTHEGKDSIAIEVIDQGIGMTPEQCKRVFERFYRADPSGNIPGTGLGMSLVKEVMEGMGGAVRVQSQYGQGTCVSLYLPVAMPGEGAIAAPAYAGLNDRGSQHYGEMTLWADSSNAKANLS